MKLDIHKILSWSQRLRVDSFSAGPVSISIGNDKDVDTAKELLIYLEDRRVLYEVYDLERPKYCVSSILQIRERLGHFLGNSKEDSVLQQELFKMRAACRLFLTSYDKYDFEWDRDESNYAWSEENERDFVACLINLRTVFAISIRRICRKYELNNYVRDGIQRLLDEFY